MIADMVSSTMVSVVANINNTTGKIVSSGGRVAEVKVGRCGETNGSTIEFDLCGVVDYIHQLSEVVPKTGSRVDF